MATIVNDRDVLLQATSPRNNAPSLGKAFLLSVDTPVFKVVSGVATPTVVNLSTQRVAINSTVSWSVSGATGLTIAGDTYSATLAYSAMTANTATVTAQTTYLGVTYIQSQIINKVTDGANGSNGSNGSNGARGTVTLVGTGYSSWSDSSAAAVISANGSGSPQNGDIVTLTNSSSFTQTKFYSFGTWYALTAYIDGNLLVSGTVSANVISGGTLNGVMVRFGTGHTPSGNAFEIVSTGVVWADNLFTGQVNANNANTGTNPAILGVSQSTAQPGVMGQVASGNSSTFANGVRGVNSNNGTEGLIAPGVAYDFYASGSGTNYGPFTGAHDALLPVDVIAEIGDILIDKHCLARGTGVSNTIFATEMSSLPNQKAAIGVIAVPLATLSLAAPPAAFVIGYGPDWVKIIDPEYPSLLDLYMRTAVNALGEGMLNVCGEGGNITAGDFIVTSSTPGKGMKQADDVLRNYTVARARESVAFSSPSEIKQIACIYLCG